MPKKRQLYTKKVNKILNKISNGESIKRSERIFHQGMIGTLNTNYQFLLTKSEALEWSKCYKDPVYFIEKYCFFETPNGPKLITIRDYQLEWINNLINNTHNIFILSRQTGFDVIKSAVAFWSMVFRNQNILSGFNKMQTSMIQKIKFMYLNIPYFLKPNLESMNKTTIKFKGSSIKICLNKNFESILDKKNDIIDINDCFLINVEKQESIIKEIKSKNIRVCLSGIPKDTPFYRLQSEKKYKSNITYWWQVPGRDEKWVKGEIKALGSKEIFDSEYNLQFKK